MNQQISGRVDQPLIILSGPTATGKTALALKLCQKFNGEIVSADSRQVYQGMDIGTGKLPFGIPKERIQKKGGLRVVDGIPIHLYDLRSPNQTYTVADFVKDATVRIKLIQEKGKTPLLVGGTGFYIKALLDGIETLGVPPDPIWRTQIQQQIKNQGLASVYAKLQRLDSHRAVTIDRFNPPRVIRALEVARFRGGNSSGARPIPRNLISADCFLWLGLTGVRSLLYRRADAWIVSALKAGLVDEVKGLTGRGWGGAAPLSGLIYGTVIDHLTGGLTFEKMRSRLEFELHNYIRRQLTWFKKEKRIEWFDVSRADFEKQVFSRVGQFLRTPRVGP